MSFIITYKPMNSVLFKLGNVNNIPRTCFKNTLWHMANFHGRCEKGKGRENWQRRGQKETYPQLTLFYWKEVLWVREVGGHGADLLVVSIFPIDLSQCPRCYYYRFPGVLKANHVYGSALKIAKRLWEDFFSNTSKQAPQPVDQDWLVDL